MGFLKVITDYLNYLAGTIRSNMDRAGVNATGQTSRSITVTSDQNDGQLTASEVLEATETGNPPKSGGGGISFFATELWLEAKGLSLNPYAVKNKIDLKGTETYRIGGRTDIYTDTIDDDYARGAFLEQIQEQVIKTITKEFRN